MPQSPLIIVKLSFGTIAALHATGCCRTTDSDRQAQLPGQMDGVLEGSVGASNGLVDGLLDGLIEGLFDG